MITSGQYLKIKREKAGLTQKQLANKIGYDEAQFISLMENNHDPIPVKKLKLICKHLKMTSNEKREFIFVLSTEYISKLNGYIS